MAMEGGTVQTEVSETQTEEISGVQSNSNDLCLYVCRDAAKQGDF